VLEYVQSCYKVHAFASVMPPKSKDKPEKDAKKTGEKKRGGKMQLPAHELVNEHTKESYLIEIRELDSRLTRLSYAFIYEVSSTLT
jgi:hypothetical protein